MHAFFSNNHPVRLMFAAAISALTLAMPTPVMAYEIIAMTVDCGPVYCTHTTCVSNNGQTYCSTTYTLNIFN